ncbi:MAG: thiamine pyrophosphate-dependent dehydrogenase E1 component subunit alpha, partial [Chloroflexi bacterium]|nr:thiamine pyrophosphate-dependent dehydrogenase E1 component subunit alpha [Chloroflexota bacterium]
QAARERDPIPRFLRWLQARGLITPDQQREIDARIKQEVDDATEYAYSRPDPTEEYLYRQVYAPQEP